MKQQIKTSEEFNDKWNDFLEHRHYGLDIENEEVVKYLDDIFTNELILIPNFSFSQIKTKYKSVRFYAEEISLAKQFEIEKAIEDILFIKK